MPTRVFVETVEGVVIARFADPELIAEDVIAQLGDELNAMIGGLGAANVLLNFREVRLMSSMMLAVLLKFSRTAVQFGGKVKLCEIAPDLREVFRITRFERLFEIYDHETTALDSFKL